MPETGGSYSSANSYFHKLDPRVKLLFTFTLIIFSIIINKLPPSIFLLLFIHAMLISAKIKIKTIFNIWKTLLPITILIIILYPISHYVISSFVITRSGFWYILQEGLIPAIRICNIVFACNTLLAATETAPLLRALVKLGCPYKFALMISLAIQAIPNFHRTISMVVDAQKVRGLDLRAGNIFVRLKKYIPVLTAAIISTLKYSETLSRALETRGFGICEKRTYYIEIKMQKTDWLFMITIAVAVIVIMFFLFR